MILILWSMETQQDSRQSGSLLIWTFLVLTNERIESKGEDSVEKLQTEAMSCVCPALWLLERPWFWKRNLLLLNPSSCPALIHMSYRTWSDGGGCEIAMKTLNPEPQREKMTCYITGHRGKNSKKKNYMRLSHSSSHIATVFSQSLLQICCKTDCCWSCHPQ